MSIEISYKGNVIASVEDGKKAIVRCNDDKMKGDIEVVSTSSETPTQEKTIDITENGTVIVEPDEGHALSKVTANVDVPETPTQEKTVDVTDNGTVVIEPDEGHTMTKVTANVNVPKEGVNLIQRYIELNGNSARFLFTYFSGTSVDELMEGVDTSNVANMERMFASCSKLTAVPLFDTSKVTTMAGMFESCSKLTAVPLFDTSKVEHMEETFGNCHVLTEVPLFNTSKLESMGRMFQYCYALTSVPLFDTSNVTKMNWTFASCSKLTAVPLFDTSKVTTMERMVFGCSSLATIPSYDARNVTSLNFMVYDCTILTECWIRNIKTNFQVGSGTSWGHLLTIESLLSLCKECRNVNASRTLTVGSANLEKLANVYVKLIDITDEMRAEDDLIDEKSPFVQCESTDEGAMLVSDYMTTKMWQLA